MGSQSMMITTLPSATRPFHSLMTSMMSTGAGGIVGGLMGGLMGAVAEEGVYFSNALPLDRWVSSKAKANADCAQQ